MSSLFIERDYKMPLTDKPLLQMTRWLGAICVLTAILLSPAWSADLPEIKQRGILRHIGIPYANFVTGSGDGMDVELMKLFAQNLGVKYEFVKASWGSVISDLTGKKVKPKGNDIDIIGEAPIRGDVIANGFTVLPWREKIVNYSTPTFPNQIWLMAGADSPLKPIAPSGDIGQDIKAVKALLKGHTLLGKANTCLDPSLYGIKEMGAQEKLFPGELNELAPAVVNGEAELTLLDVPDALVALEKWPGKIKVIGPLSPHQKMAVAFPKNSPQLLEAFNQFFEKCKADGRYISIVKKYYPAVFDYYADFFKGNK
jgi:ABC-type amino acid transport substrate-binding protein